MNTLLSYISIIPYIFYLYLLIKDEILNKKSGKDLFRFDTLILVGVFVYFTTYKTPLVNKLLFFTITLYLLVNKLYDVKIQGKINLKSELLKIVFVYILAFILFLPYILAKKLTLSYYLAFALILLIHFVMLFVKKICKK